MAGETSRDRYLGDRWNVRAGKRVVGAAILVLVTSSLAGLAVFPVVLAVLTQLPIRQPIADAAWVAAMVFIAAAVALAVAFVYESRWLWAAYGAWLAAFVVMVAMVGLTLAPESVIVALVFGAIATAFAGAVGWIIRRFDAPAV
jgi:hypothetical protein